MTPLVLQRERHVRGALKVRVQLIFPDLRVVGHGNSFSTGVFKQLIYQGEMPYSEFVSRYPGFTEDSDRSEKLLATGETVVLTVRIQKTDEALPDFPVSDEGCSDRSDDGFE